ncbi:MAG: hypothetical protein RL344_665 [Pseudomonadota bacterium]|jgi:pyrroline-5-carboxylate reductase
MIKNISVLDNKLNVAFLGAGNMASAIVQGLYHSGCYTLSVAEPHQPTLLRWQTDYAAQPLNINADVLILAVKPQQFSEAAKSLCGKILPNTVVISIMAGVSIIKISEALGGHSAIIRTMPNTPARIAQGITGLYATPSCTLAHKKLVEDIMHSIGQTVYVDTEMQLDAVTALSGSGPAYVFYIAQALLDAGVQLGLTPSIARQLALATLQGSAALAAQSGEDLIALREQVTSKGGTTAAAMDILHTRQVAQAFHAALAAADARAKGLALLD